MKFIAFTFDDGRSDNYLLAKQIMDNYNFRGTVYVTTGFIDGTWEGQDILQSPTRPLTVEEINGLHSSAVAKKFRYCCCNFEKKCSK